KVILSKDGLAKRKQELEERKTLTRQKIADEIDKARQQGDLSENAAYKAALESKEFNENRIEELEDIIKNAEVVENTNNKKVGIGSEVEVENLSNGQAVTFKIVGDREADPATRAVSINSPIGSALNNKTVGET